MNNRGTYAIGDPPSVILIEIKRLFFQLCFSRISHFSNGLQCVDRSFLNREFGSVRQKFTLLKLGIRYSVVRSLEKK